MREEHGGHFKCQHGAKEVVTDMNSGICHFLPHNWFPFPACSQQVAWGKGFFAASVEVAAALEDSVIKVAA